MSIEGDHNYQALMDALPSVNSLPLTKRLTKEVNQKIKYVEGDFGVNFIEFATYIACGDAQKLFDWRSKLKIKSGAEETFDRYFINEHFKWHTNQANRELEKSDLDTLLWIKSLYDGAKPHKSQPLPFPKSPMYFFHHLCTVEATVSSIAAVWCMTNPNVVFGFLPRADAVDVMRANDSRVGTFFFRLSNSDPSMLCLVFAAAKESIVQMDCKQNEGELSKTYKVKQELVQSFTSMTEFKNFLLRRPELIKILPDKNGNVKSRDDIIGVFDNNLYLADIRTKFEQFESCYTIVFSSAPNLRTERSFEESKDDFQPGMMNRQTSIDSQQGQGNGQDVMNNEMGSIYSPVI